MISEAIKKVVGKGDLSYDEAYQVMNEIMNGESSPTQNAAYLAALSTKSTKAETLDEIRGSATAMREHATPVEHSMPVLEIVGTGGDHLGSINISTPSAIICAAAGVAVAKHGNRAASSKSGSADCLEALGVNIDLTPEKCTELLDKIGICFMFAQKYHASMKYVGAIRRELGIRTVFNILGPLTNPAQPEYMALGVYDEYLVEPLAKVMMTLGVKRGVVFHGHDGLDEVSVSGPTDICEFKDGFIRTEIIKPEDFGIASSPVDEIIGGTPEENAKVVRDIFNGVQGPKYDIVIMNSGASLFAAAKTESIAEGIELAKETIASGAAKAKLDEFIEFSNR